MGKVKKYIDETPDDTLYIEIYPGDVGFELYEDDGETNLYKTGDFSTTQMKCMVNGENIYFEIGDAKGKFAGQVSERCWILKFNLVSIPDSIFVNGLKMEIEEGSISFSRDLNSAWFDKDKSILYVKLFSEISNQVKLEIYGARVIVGVKGEDKERRFVFYQNYPNPFNSEITVEIELVQDESLKVLVYDLLGRKVREIEFGNLSAGRHKFKLNFNDIPSGVYFFRIVSGKFVEVGEMVLVR